MAHRPGATGNYESPIIGGRIYLEVNGPDDRKDFTDEIDLIIARLKIDPNDLMNEAANHPSMFARLAVLSEEAASNARWAKRAAELARADLQGDLRKHYSTSESKKPSEEAIKAEIERDDDVVAAVEYQLDSERTAGILKGLVASVRDRREMIAEMMRDQRHEWKTSAGDD